jgi:hypothetical protein
LMGFILVSHTLAKYLCFFLGSCYFC